MRDALIQAKTWVRENRQADALTLIRSVATPDTDSTVITRAARWAKTVKWKGMWKLRLAFLGGGTLNHLVDFIEFWMLLRGVQITTHLPLYNTWKMEIINPGSELYRFNPEVTWIFTHRHTLELPEMFLCDEDKAVQETENAITDLSGLWNMLKTRLPATQILQNNCDPDPENLLGNFAVMTPGSRRNMIWRFNCMLPIATSNAGVMLFDLDRLATLQGLERWYNPSFWFHSKHPFAPTLSNWIGYRCAQSLASIKGTSKKVVVLDLDNTLWGGVIGDDGIEGIKLGAGAEGEAFIAFQGYLRGLSHRGIILAVASKNEEDTAKGPFLSHPDMRLSLDDITVFKANWRNKADNIRDIAVALNLGLESFVFVDDNPAERELVRRELPMVAVPEMPDDPAEYIRTLERYAYFEISSLSNEDGHRKQMYRENVKRFAARAAATNLDEYLLGLEMTADSGSASDFYLPRMAQLINKSNQFHPTTTRYTEAELRELANRKDCIIRWFSLQDKFGDHGLIAVLILKRENDAFVIDTWAMSCRILERGMEDFILDSLCRMIHQCGGRTLIGKYCPSGKNTLVAVLYDRLGFCFSMEKDGVRYWSLDIATRNLDRKSTIRIARKYEP